MPLVLSDASLEISARVIQPPYSVRFTGNLNSPAPDQAFYGNLGSIVITYEYVGRRLALKLA